MTIAIMLDIETLSFKPESVILTLGAVKFNPFVVDDIRDGLYLRLDVDEQVALGREIDESTVEWWGKQLPEIRDEALTDEGRISLAEFHSQLNKFLVGVDEIWCQGPVFDIGILEHFYRQNGWPRAWHYWQVRDSRTLFGVHGDPRDRNSAGLHNAFEDCLSQAKAVQKVYQRLNLTKESKWQK